MRAYHGIPPTGPVSEDMAKTLKHGYYACVSYVDAQIGKLMDTLDELGLADNTIVVLWGDHGWNLREHGLWCKHCNFETSLHAPLMIKAPGMKSGVQVNGITEFIDIYPTLCELAGLDRPAHLAGTSLMPVLSGEQQSVKDYAVCRWKNGITLIKDQYFYTEWVDEQGELQTRMLYNHENDPRETVDISAFPEQRERVQTFSTELREKWGKDFWTDFPFEAYSH
ncbi:MAG: sulfatase-like hydrolase/transferase [candidate division KSB1 bacterium]|nr:sulfatase-like hydrolase/transferase [candidate division KSB1 bacterium]